MRDLAAAEGLSAESGPRLSPGEFALFRAFLHREAGIALRDDKRPLVENRLRRRVAATGSRSYGEYYRRCVERDLAERQRMIDCLCTNETSFFRDARQFAWIEHEFLPRWRRRVAEGARPPVMRVWSAACSTGEEPFSLAMLALDALADAPGLGVEVIASDLSTRALEAARSATFPLRRAAEIPEKLLKRFMLRGTGEQAGNMRAAKPLREVVRFTHVNLTAADAFPGGCDLVLCRNVMIYFDAQTRARLMKRLALALAPGGALLLGHADGVLDGPAELRRMMPTVFGCGGDPAWSSP